MKSKICVLILIFVMSLCACTSENENAAGEKGKPLSGVETVQTEQPRADDEAKQEELQEGSGLTSSAAEAYAEVLERFINEKILPDGTECVPDEPIDLNEFALHDINADGEKELIFKYTNTYMAGMAEFVLSYSETDDEVSVLFSGFPMMTYYDNGVITVGFSHNQGVAGEALWPYTLYAYDEGAGTYVERGMVDAWDKSLTEVYQGMPFPDEADRSGTGVVYYVMTEGVYETTEPVDVTDYNAWLNSYIDGAKILEINYMSLTESNIGLLKK